MTASFNPSTQTLALPVSPILPVGTTLTAPVPSYVDTQVSLAPTSSTLTSVTCSSGTSDAKGVELSVDNTLTQATITNLQLSEAVFTTQITIAGITLASARVRVGTANANVTVTLGSSGASDLSLMVPPRLFDTGYPTQSGGATLEFSLNSTPYVEVVSMVAGIPVYPALSLTSSQQRQLADLVAEAVLGAQFDVANSTGVLNTLVKPLLGLAGAGLAGSDVALLSQPPMDCGTPALRG